MPHIRIRAMTDHQVAQASIELPELLAATMQTTSDNFTFEKLHSSFFERGKEISSYPFVEVWWFKRSQELQDQAALQITDTLKKLSGAEDVIVSFYEIPRQNYYENGNHY